MAEMKKGRLTIRGDGSVELLDNLDLDDPGPTEDQAALARQIGATIRAYLDAAQELLGGKYSHIRDLAPVHLATPGNVLVVTCPDGLAIRFERKTDRRRVFGAWTNDSLLGIAPILSQNVVHCYADRNFTSTIPNTGIELKLFSEDPAKNVRQQMVAFKTGFDAVIEKPASLPIPPRKPFCLLSVRNAFELVIEGVMMDVKAKSLEQGRHFMTRTMMRLPVAWECIEIYPFFEPGQWNPAHAALWAENDLLASVVARQLRESRFQQLDPNAAARRGMAALLKSYKDLLDSNPDREEVLQTFLRDHPSLLCPTQINTWPKLQLGRHITDFVFQEAAGEYLLVELEPPDNNLFRKDGLESGELNHAIGQTDDWVRYLEDNLATVQRELGLAGISAAPRRLVVIGRSGRLAPEDRRKLVSMENRSPKLKIMTYDDVHENAKAVVENLLGPFWDVGGSTQVYYPPKS